jgi:hypothetical protein
MIRAKLRDAAEWLCVLPPVILVYLVVAWSEPLWNPDAREP